MNSGIYKFYFPDDSFYIGRSYDFEKRWKQHRDSMVKNKHTPKIQEKYKTYGFPTFEVVTTCHPDHCDIVETLFITKLWKEHSHRMLNASIPTELSSDYWNRLVEVAEYLPLGTLELMEKLKSLELKLDSDALTKQLKELESEVEEWREMYSSYVDEAEKNLALEKRVLELENGLKSQSFWQKIKFLWGS